MTLEEHRQIKNLKSKYLPGTEIMLIKMNDFQAPPFGTKGKVDYVDDLGNIHMIWDNGSTLSLIEGVDIFKVIKYATGDEQ